MNPIVEEMNAILAGDEDVLAHYGMPRRSGRYPWGSGEDPYQHGSRDFYGRIEQLKKEGWTETPENIMKEFGLTTTQYRAQKSIAKDERRLLKVETAKRLRDKEGMGPSEIARKMSEQFGESINESSVRSLLNEKSEVRTTQARNTADFLKKQIEEKGMIDVGAGVDLQLNISNEMLKKSLAILEAEGYPVIGGRVPQPNNPDQMTTIKVVCPKDTPYRIDDKGRKVSAAIYDYENIHSAKDYITRDGGETYEKKFTYPSSMDSKRLMIRYKEDGGVDQDGLVEIRRGVPDLSLGESMFSQVRILVDGTHYIKGMAVYSDGEDMPKGVDVIFNTNKSKGTPVTSVLKKIKDDPENPFGSTIKDADLGGQYWYDADTGQRCSANDPNVKNKKLGLINKRADEGDWGEWKNAIPSQFLSKQPLKLAKQQLNLASVEKVAEFDEICSLTNPTVKKVLLGKFADECDSAAVHLQAAALPRQRYHVIIPNNTLKDNEVYAPGYKDGEQLALIRYPHGGTFEIPICTVTTKNALGKKRIGTETLDAICINSKVAERLSGADFDGDTVMCIPTNDPAGKVKIKSTNKLKGLEGFDPKIAYGGEAKTGADGKEHYYRNGREYKVMTEAQKGIQMGVVSNLITDMTLLGANSDELAKAVRHSMVVIDAPKHKLDYKQSEIDNDIASLKKLYQTGGASTLISRAKSPLDVPKRVGSPKVNMAGKEWYDPTKPEGALIWKNDENATYLVTKTNKRTGEVTTETKTRTQRSTRMMETDDARTLISDADTPMERLYANYANQMKSLANQARKEMMTTGKIKYQASAKETYREEVSSLNSKLNTALVNAPKERQAVLKTNAEINKKLSVIKERLRADHPNATNSELTKMAKKELDVKKTGTKALKKYREEVGAVSRTDRSIKITDKEWEAIQAGAVSENVLMKILNNADIDALRERATPRTGTTVTQAKINTIKAMSASNYTLSQIAEKTHLSTATISKYLKGVK